MSKRHGKSRQTNPNRARSKNNPGGKRNDPKTDWPGYNKDRRSEGRRFIRWMRRIAEIAREILGIAPGTRDRRVSAMTVSIIKGEENLSYWGLIKHFDRHPDDLDLCELSRPYCRSWYQLRISEIDPAVLQKIITRMAGDEAVHGTLLVDSSGFSIARYIDWQNAKYGKISVRLFAKLHIMHTLHGMACAAIVTPGKSNDSPYLRQMIETLPKGDGDVVADAGLRGRQELQRHPGQWPEDRHRLQIQRGYQGIQRQGGDVEVPRGASGDIPPDTAPSEQRRERLLVHEGAVRRGGARPQGEDPIG